LKKYVNSKHYNVLKKIEKKLIVLWRKMKDDITKRNQIFF
jgi:hypothetical protein